MADAATMTIKAVLLPDEIQKTLKDLSFEYTPANNTEGWYYKLTDVTTSSADLISTETYLQFGGTAQGEDTGSAMHAVHANDVVKFLFIKHTGKTDDGSTGNTADSVYLCFDGGTAAHNLADAVEVGPGETWFAKFNGLTVGNFHCISGQKAGAGTGSAKIQCVVAAILDNV